MLNPNFHKSVNNLKKMLFLIILTTPSFTYAESHDAEITRLQQQIDELKSLIAEENDKSMISHETLPKEKLKVISSAQNVKTQVKLYGFIRGDASYQFSGGNGIFNRINKVDLNGHNENKNRFDSTVTATRLGLDFQSHVLEDVLSGKLEVDFRGGENSDSMKIRHAYISYNNWLIGQTTSTFLDTNYNPDMIDFGSPLGIGTKRTPMVRYSDKFNHNTQYSIGLEQGQANNKLPVLTSKVKHYFSNGKASVSVRGLVQEIKDRKIDSQSELSWGLGVGGNYKITNHLEFKGDYSHVKGDSTFMLYSNSGYDVNEKNKDLNLNEFDAFAMGITYKFSSQLQSTLAYGAMFADNKNAFAKQAKLEKDDNQNKSLQQGWVNLIYSPITPLSFGIEYIYGERETFMQEKGRDSRINTMVKYSF